MCHCYPAFIFLGGFWYGQGFAVGSQFSTMKPYLLTSTLLLCSIAFAQESRTETQSVRCAALSYIGTSLSAAEPSVGEFTTRSASMSGNIFGASRKFRTGLPTTNGELGARRDVLLAEFKKFWESNPEGVIREGALCSTWLLEFSPRLSSINSASSDADLLRVVGEPPTSPSAREITQWRAVAPRAFASWEMLGYATPASIRKKLVDSMK